MVDSDEETPPVPTYSEEQRALKEDLKSALNSAVGEEPLLTIRTKSDQEKVSFVLILCIIGPKSLKESRKLFVIFTIYDAVYGW